VTAFHARVRLLTVSLRIRALVTVVMLMVGAMTWTSAASASSPQRFATESVCEASHCDAPVPDSCRTVCQHVTRLLPATKLTMQVPMLRRIEFGVWISVASGLNLSERLDRPPR
jgi:hypothetical protein